MPVDLVPQLLVVEPVCKAFNVPVLTEPGMEADDVIATVARLAEERGVDVYICTADKGARQLLDDHVRIYNLPTQKVLNIAAIKADWGVTPEQVVDLLALPATRSTTSPECRGSV